DVTYEEAESLLSTYFSDWKRGEVRTQALSTIRPEKKKKTITVDRELTQATILLGHAGVSRDDPDYYALSVMNYILGGGGFASRLMQNIREEKGLVYDIHSYFSAEKYGGSFRIGLQTKNESANTAIAEILHEVQNIMSEPVTDTELADAQSFLTGSFPMRIETSSSIAAFLVAVEYYGLGMDYKDNYPSFINGITKEDITRVARKHLNPEDYVLVVVANQKETSLSEEFVK
ncbi:MAG: insulinase family protein, partial [Nitrospiraceae bacterium]